MDDDMRAIVDRLPTERKYVPGETLWPDIDDEYIRVQKWLYILRQCIDVRSPDVANDSIRKCVDALLMLHEYLSVQMFLDVGHHEDDQ